MLLIVLALLAILTKSLILLATEVTFVAAVAIVGLFSDFCRPERTTDKSFDCFRRGAAVAEGHFELADHLQQAIAVRPAARPIAGSSLVRRLVQAKDDPAKQRIRAQLRAIDDERLFCLGLTPEDIVVLRGTASSPAEATIAQGLGVPPDDHRAVQPFHLAR